MVYKENYFNNTPFYKIWIDIIDIIIPLFSSHFVNAGFGAGDVVCNRKGILFNFTTNQQRIELAFRSSSRSFLFTRYNANDSQIVDFETLEFRQLLNEDIEVTKELLLHKVEEWKGVLVETGKI